MMKNELTLYVDLHKNASNDWILHYVQVENELDLERAVNASELINLDQLSQNECKKLIPDFVGLGCALHSWLDGPDRLISSLIDKTKNATEVLILAFEINSPLVHLPWELLFDGKQFLVEYLNPAVVPVRIAGTRKIIRDEAQNRSLRVLFMATSPEGVGDTLGFEKEEALILEATSKHPIQIIVEESGNINELRSLIESYEQDYFDIVHITGHATLTEQGGRFLMEDEIGRPHLCSAKEIIESLSRIPKFLFLSGCSTGESQERHGIPSIAEELVKAGISAVLGWGQSVTELSASAAAAALYHSISTGSSIAKALSVTFQALIAAHTSEWQLLRLYVGGGLPSSLVTPLMTPGREPVPTQSSADRFLDKEYNIRVAARTEFVGRRRSLQACLRALKYDAKVGVFIYGMGGIGKSSLAARLCDRLSEFHPIVIQGKINEKVLTSTLAEQIRSKYVRDQLFDLNSELKYRLWNALSKEDNRLLIVLDDFEVNCLQSDGVPIAYETAPQITPEAESILEALRFAIYDRNSSHRIIITCRYEICSSEMLFFHSVPLSSLHGADLRKKIDFLDRSSDRPIDQSLKERAIVIADGNPRLLEWLFAVLRQDTIDHYTILRQLEKSESAFKEDILAEQLLLQQSTAMIAMLARAAIYKIPIPFPALSAVCTGITNLYDLVHHASSLGLVETVVVGTVQHYRVPRIFHEYLKRATLEFDIKELAGLAAHALVKIWGREGQVMVEGALEIRRLALLGKVRKIAIDMTILLAGAWQHRGLHQQVNEVALDTLKEMPGDVTLLSILGRSMLEIGDLEQAINYNKEALNNCADNDYRRKAHIMHNLGIIYAQRGQTDEALKHFFETLEMDRRIDNKAGEAMMYYEIGKVYRRQHRFKEAEKMLRQALDTMKGKVDSHNVVAGSLHELGTLLSLQRRLDESLEHYIEALKLSQEIGDEQRTSALLSEIGDCYELREEHDEALLCYRNALEISKSIGYIQGTGTTLMQIAKLHSNQENFDDAWEFAEQALDIMQRIGDMEGMAGLLCFLSQLHLLDKVDIDKSRDLLKQSLNIQERTGYTVETTELLSSIVLDDDESVANKLHHIARSLAKEGRYERAIRFFESAIFLERRGKGTRIQSIALYELGNVYETQGEIQRAKELYKESLRHNCAVNDRRGQAKTLHYHGLLYSHLHQYEEALSYYWRSIEIDDAIEDMQGKGITIKCIADIYRNQGKFDAALSLYRDSVKLSKQVNDLVGLEKTLKAMIAVLDEQGKAKEATEMKGEYELTRAMIEGDEEVR